MNVRTLKDNAGAVFSPKVSTDSVYLSGSKTNLTTKLSNIDNSISGKADSFTVSSSENTAAWGKSVTVGTVAGTDLKFVMPANPNTDTHYKATPVLGASDAIANASTATGNTATYLNIVENGGKSGGIQVKGSGATTVSAVNGVLTISSTDNNTTNVSATTTGSGNAVTSVTASGSAITVTKGTTFLTAHQDISGKEDKSNKVTAWSATTTDTHYPSEKLVKSALDGKAASSHTHTKSQITDFPSSMPASDVYDWAKESSKPSYAWDEITSKPTSFTPASHTHAKSQITDFPTSMPASDVYPWAKAANKPSYAWDEITSKPTEFTPASHTHDDRYYTESESDSKFLVKTSYEFNKEIAFGSTGYLCIGKFPCYDSNITVYIDSTTYTTYHGVLIIATQNINTSGGGTLTANTYGDVSNTLTSALKLEYNSGSNSINIYFQPKPWSKNLIHIRCNALAGAPTDIVTSISSIPATANRTITNLLKSSLDDKASSSHTHTKANITDFPTIPTKTSQLTNDSGFLTSVPSHTHDYLPLSGGTCSGNIYASGFYVSSLRSLKENIEPTKVKATDLINSQEIVDFNYKADKDKVHKIGLIADDSDPLFLDKKGETVDLYNTCGILMKAVQELSKRVEELEQKLK